jgi:hypothetical protein
MNTFATRSSSCCVNGTSNRRITRDEVVTLRNISIAKKSVSEEMTQAFVAMMNSLKSALSAPINTAAPKNNMCKFYGHVIQGPWQGFLPKCRDCGCEIKSPDQLRKAMPTR